MTIADAPDVMTVREAAALLRISQATLYLAIRNDQFPAVRIRGRITVGKSNLIAYLAQQSIPSK